MSNINALVIGNEDWNEKFNIPDFINISFYKTPDNTMARIYDMVFLDRAITEEERKLLMRRTRSYCLFVTENVEATDETQYFMDCRKGIRLYTGDLDAFWEQRAKNYFGEPYGERFNPSFLEVNPLFDGQVIFKGNYNLELEGNFGEEFSQAVFWKNNIPIQKEQCLDLYLEHEVSGSVEIQMKIVSFWPGSVEGVARVWTFSGQELKDVIRLDNTGEAGFISVSIQAKGQGKLNIISLHDRFSRRDFGFFLPGGDRYVDSKGEELFCYFDPGDLKPPLSFYFSGHRTQEGFEGYYMMRSLGCPFVLVADSRLSGGCFYCGSEEYESMVYKALNSYIQKINFKPSQVILSGISMGSFGAMYYGSRILPRAIIVGKPLPNLGNMAENERIFRAGGFEASLAMLLKNFGDLSPESVEKFNNKFWDAFDYANWENTEFIISYLYEDDYDNMGYPDILSHLKSSGVQVNGKGTHGRHNDNSDIVIQWFKSQFLRVLRDEFDRG